MEKWHIGSSLGKKKLTCKTAWYKESKELKRLGAHSYISHSGK